MSAVLLDHHGADGGDQGAEQQQGSEEQRIGAQVVEVSGDADDSEKRDHEACDLILAEAIVEVHVGGGRDEEGIDRPENRHEPGGDDGFGPVDQRIGGGEVEAALIERHPQGRFLTALTSSEEVGDDGHAQRSQDEAPAGCGQWRNVSDALADDQPRASPDEAHDRDRARCQRGGGGLAPGSRSHDVSSRTRTAVSWAHPQERVTPAPPWP